MGRTLPVEAKDGLTGRRGGRRSDGELGGRVREEGVEGVVGLVAEEGVDAGMAPEGLVQAPTEVPSPAPRYANGGRRAGTVLLLDKNMHLFLKPISKQILNDPASQRPALVLILDLAQLLPQRF